MGFRNNDDKNVMNNPGPGQYNTASVDEMKVGGKIGTSKRSNFGGNAYVPGPGNYNPQSRPYSAGPKYGFTREIKSTFGVNNDPGRIYEFIHSWTILNKGIFGQLREKWYNDGLQKRED